MRLVFVRVPFERRGQVENIIRAGRYRNVSTMKSADKLALHFLFRARARRLQLLLRLLDQIGVGRVYGSYDVMHLDVNKMAPGPLGRGIVTETGMDPDLEGEENPRYPLVVHTSSEEISSESGVEDDGLASQSMSSGIRKADSSLHSSDYVLENADSVSELEPKRAEEARMVKKRRRKKRQKRKVERLHQSSGQNEVGGGNDKDENAVFDESFRGQVNEWLKDDAAVAAAAAAASSLNDPSTLRSLPINQSNEDVENMNASAQPKDAVELDAWEGLSKDGNDDGGRLSLEEIWISIAGSSKFSFDYAIYVVLASIIAGLGLATNNNVAVVAAMLVSPLMNPILGFTFGTTIRDWKLVRTGLLAEAIGVFLAVLSGFVVGLCFVPFVGPNDAFPWPTIEMSSRGEPSNLVVGVGIASASGAAVALSVILGGISPLVGVAISASLLPPFVNTGVLLAFALLGHVTNPSFSSSHKSYLAGISFSLAVINIACIYVFGLLVFWLKDILPIKSSTFRVKDLSFDREEMWNFEKKVEAGDIDGAFQECPNIPDSVKKLAVENAGYGSPSSGRARSSTFSYDPRHGLGAFPFFGFGTSNMFSNGPHHHGNKFPSSSKTEDNLLNGIQDRPQHARCGSVEGGYPIRVAQSQDLVAPSDTIGLQQDSLESSIAQRRRRGMTLPSIALQAPSIHVTPFSDPELGTADVLISLDTRRHEDSASQS